VFVIVLDRFLASDAVRQQGLLKKGDELCWHGAAVKGASHNVTPRFVACIDQSDAVRQQGLLKEGEAL
jgi:hypothetical protein